MKKLASVNEVTQADVGSYIRLEGQGIMDGLKGEAVKLECYKIVAVFDNALDLKGYRRHSSSTLGEGYFQQKAEVYTPVEFKKLSTSYRSTNEHIDRRIPQDRPACQTP